MILSVTRLRQEWPSSPGNLHLQLAALTVANSELQVGLELSTVSSCQWAASNWQLPMVSDQLAVLSGWRFGRARVVSPHLSGSVSVSSTQGLDSLPTPCLTSPSLLPHSLTAGSLTAPSLLPHSRAVMSLPGSCCAGCWLLATGVVWRPLPALGASRRPAGLGHNHDRS